MLEYSSRRKRNIEMADVRESFGEHMLDYSITRMSLTCLQNDTLLML